MAAGVVHEHIRKAFPNLAAKILIFSLLLFASCVVFAQESPYIVTYDHYLEEPGSLEVGKESYGRAPRNQPAVPTT